MMRILLCLMMSVCILMLLYLPSCSCGENDDNNDEDPNIKEDDDAIDDDVSQNDDDDVAGFSCEEDSIVGTETWTDSLTGLEWQVTPPCESFFWDEAVDYCWSLVLGGFSDWRLPSISELRTLLSGCPETETGGECGVTDECQELSCWSDICLGCTLSEGPDNGCYGLPEISDYCMIYWANNILPEHRRWIIDFNGGGIGAQYNTKGESPPSFFTICVR